MTLQIVLSWCTIVLSWCRGHVHLTQSSTDNQSVSRLLELKGIVYIELFVLSLGSRIGIRTSTDIRL
jgi:hypothetical protein